MIKNNQYFARKARLVEAMSDALAVRDYGFYFSDTKKFWPVYCDKPREEYLEEVFIDDDGRIAVSTWYYDEDGQNWNEVSPFSEFSNDEMETIMGFCGVEIPQEGEFYVE